MSPRARVPGQQLERTALAWQRTAIAVLLLSVLTLGVAARLADAVLLFAAALATGVAASAAMLVVPRSARPRAADSPTSAHTRLTAVAAATVVLALAGVAAAVLSAGAHPG